jgi:hypothetical protein
MEERKMSGIARHIIVATFVLFVVFPVCRSIDGAEPATAVAVQALRANEAALHSVDIEWTTLLDVKDISQTESNFNGMRMCYRYVNDSVREYLHVQTIMADGRTSVDYECVWTGSAGYTLVHSSKRPVYVISTERSTSFNGVRIPTTVFVNVDTIAGLLDSGQAVLAKEEAIDGVACRKYSGKMGEASSTDFEAWLDPANDYQWRRFRCGHPDYYESTTTVTDGKQINGVWVPMRWVNEHKDFTKNVTKCGVMIVKQVNVNEGVDDAVFTLTVPENAKVEDMLIPG